MMAWDDGADCSGETIGGCLLKILYIVSVIVLALATCDKEINPPWNSPTETSNQDSTL